MAVLYRWAAVRDVAGALATSVVDLVFPRRCGVCGDFGAFVCPQCAAALCPLGGERCVTCADPAPGGACRVCAVGSDQALTSLAAAFAFEGAARTLVLRLKYDRLSALAAPMGEMMAAVVTVTRPPGSEPVLMPVPLHPRRQRDRGFNQSLLLARAAGRAWGLPVAGDGLQRQRPTAPQARISGRVARAENVAGAFRCRAQLAGREVVLIDDVATTGATLQACAAALRDAGAAAVHARVFAHGD